MIESTERGVGDARASFAEMLADAAAGKITYVTRYGARLAAVVPVDVAEETEGKLGRSRKCAHSAA
jgi:antitoxin (DNA-binding transcriptional repressor) of toxin-antitoxin stability system